MSRPMNYTVWFIAWALVCLITGTGVGFWFMTPMGGDLAMLPTHAHFNLLGWVTLALYGLIHNAFPLLARHRLARVQFWLALMGGVGLPIGFATLRESPIHKIVIGTGAIGAAIAALMFAYMFLAVFGRRGDIPR